MASVISARNITKIYGEAGVQTVVLKDISLEIQSGEFISIVGPSGSGKSTLMYMLGLLDVPTKGFIYIDGKNTKDLTEEARARLRNQKIGFVFQTYNLLGRTTALSNVMLPLVYSGTLSSKRKEKAKKLLYEVGLSHRLSSFPSQLSGGEQQRVAIARALVCEPSVILADEPTGNLDTKTGSQILSLLSSLNDKGTTVVIVTHNRDIAKVAKRVIRIKDGRIVSDKRK